MGHNAPSMQCIISALCYLIILYHLSEHFIVKQAYGGLLRVYDNGFSAWVGNVCELVRMYNLDRPFTVNEFRNECKKSYAKLLKWLAR